MTLRIDTTSENSKTIVSVAGRLAGRAVGDLLKLYQSTEGEVVLDLMNLQSIDSEGVRAIREMVRQGAILQGVSPFIRLLLGDQPS